MTQRFSRRSRADGLILFGRDETRRRENGLLGFNPGNGITELEDQLT